MHSNMGSDFYIKTILTLEETGDKGESMARRPRVFAPGLLYHVIVRGNQRQKTFLNDTDYRAISKDSADTKSATATRSTPTA